MNAEPLPKVALGTVFLWRDKMWRRGKGIIYRAHPAEHTWLVHGEDAAYVIREVEVLP